MTVDPTHLRLEHSGIVFTRDITIRSVSPACQNLQDSGQGKINKNKTVTAVTMFPECTSPHQLITH